MTDRERLEAVAQSYNDLIALQKAQKVTTAQMIRACVKQLKLPDPTKRGQALKALCDLADLLEKGV